MHFPGSAARPLLLALIVCSQSVHATIRDQWHDVNLHVSHQSTAIAHERAAYQTFTAGLSGTLSRVDLGVFRSDETIADLNVSIWEVDSGAGLFNLLSTSTLPVSSIPLSGGFDVFALTTFSAPASIVSGQSYAIELTSEASNDFPFQSRFDWAYGTTGYSDGQAFLNQGFGYFLPAENFDFLFATYVTPIPEPGAYAAVLGATALLLPLARRRRRKG